MSRFDLTRNQFVRLGLGLGAASILGCKKSNDAGDTAFAKGKDLVIDSHMHAWTDDVVAFPYAHPFDKATYVPGKAPGNVEIVVKEMDQLGIDHCVLIQGIQHGWDNRYIASCLKKFPKRFRAHGLMDPTATGLAATLDMWMTQYGLSGMRINPVYYIGKEQWIDSAEHTLLWKKADDLGAVFNYFITTAQLPRLETMVKLFPGVQIVIDHLARLNLADANPMAEFQKLLALAAYPNVAVKVSELAKLSPSHAFAYPETYSWVRAEVMWATGEQELDLIRTKIGFQPQDIPKILGRTAARIWKFPIT